MFPTKVCFVVFIVLALLLHSIPLLTGAEVLHANCMTGRRLLQRGHVEPSNSGGHGEGH
ncbi:hypothetical protein RHMOL_Rhmol04G0110800 [Rhododendron molle]|uniref:Uncharacterized protein n=1 Tax=Rhododendron molle TaxID=49168 RepID=A0ACC0P1A7_RHOML|nr:hypothetical protein RHMOL_Rhmol04G0110800 [Rhododendron molle]